MKAVGPKAECKIRKRHFKVLFSNIRSIYWFNRYTVFFSVVDLFLKRVNSLYIIV